MTVNERVKEIRKTEKLTLEKFGKKLGVGKTAISSIEHGINGVTDQMIKSICREFDYREEWLRDGIEPKKPIIDEDTEYGQICAELGITDANAKKVIMNYGKMSPEDKKLFWSFINQLVEDEKTRNNIINLHIELLVCICYNAIRQKEDGSVHMAQKGRTPESTRDTFGGSPSFTEKSTVWASYRQSFSSNHLHR